MVVFPVRDFLVGFLYGFLFHLLFCLNQDLQDIRDFQDGVVGGRMWLVGFEIDYLELSFIGCIFFNTFYFFLGYWDKVNVLFFIL